jgi:hypothetical protein
MTIKTTRRAVKLRSTGERGFCVRSLTTDFLIANLELEFRLTYRELSPLEISNRKKTRVLRAPRRIAILDPATGQASRHSTQWHRHSCLCAHAKPRTPWMANAATSLSAKIPIVNPNTFSNRDTAIRISPNSHQCSDFEISNRDKTRLLCPPWRKVLFHSAKNRSLQLQRYLQSVPQIDPAFTRAYTYIPPKEKPSWKTPSY